MKERSRQDRRQWKNSGFPLRDHRGNIVRYDRRLRPERRLAQIEAEWLEIMQESGHSTARCQPVVRHRVR